MTEERLCWFSLINLALPTSVKEIYFGVRIHDVDEDPRSRDGWKDIDNALNDPKLKNLTLVGICLYNVYGDGYEGLKLKLREQMPRSHQRGILRVQGDESDQ